MNAVAESSRIDNIAEFRAAGVGERLKAARIAKGLQLGEVARRLHLSDRMLAALEADDMDDLPPRVFVRGYLVNYARLVGLQEASILKQFDEHHPSEETSEPLQRVGEQLPHEVRSHHGVMRLATTVVVLATLGLFAVWWVGYLDWDQAAAPANEVPAAFDDELPARADDGRLVLPNLGSEPASSPAPVPAPAPAPAAPTDAGEPLSVTPAPRAAASPPVVTVPAAPAAVSPPPAAAPVPAPAAPAVAPTPAPEPAVTAAADGPTVQVRFTGSCWVDIRDSSGRYKLFGEMQAGRQETLGGQGPYKFVLGNANVVDVRVDGESYDLARHSRGNVARFTLDPGKQR